MGSTGTEKSDNGFKDAELGVLYLTPRVHKGNPGLNGCFGKKGPSMRLATCLLAAIVLASIPRAEASLITYNFSVTATSGPLSGTTAPGTFTYDSSSIVLGGSNDSTGLLTALNFTWDGILYDQTTANTGFLVFDATGTLTTASFGNNCIAGACTANAAFEQWYIVTGTSQFKYAMSGVPSIFDGTETASLAKVPEPSTLVLLSAGFGALLLAGLRKQRRA
jgi:PEP-CTERM motif